MIGWLSHLQGFASAGVATMKSDIKEAFVNFVSCKWRAANAEYEEEQRLLKSGVKKSEVRAMRSKTKCFKMSNYPYDMPRQREDFKFEDEVHAESGTRISTGSGPSALATSDAFVEDEIIDPEAADHDEATSALMMTGVAENEE